MFFFVFYPPRKAETISPKCIRCLYEPLAKVLEFLAG